MNDAGWEFTRKLLAEAAEQWALGRLREDELPAFAINALEERADGEKLRRLAGWVPEHVTEPRRLFLDQLEEIGIVLKSAEEIVRERARPIVEAVVEGRLNVPFLADVLVEVVGRDQLLPPSPLYSLYVYAADSLDDPDTRRTLEEMAVEEAKRLLETNFEEPL